MTIPADRPADAIAETPAETLAGASAEAAPLPDPAHRRRRTRRTSALRELVRETRLHPRQLVAPLFVRPGRGVREPVGSMPGVVRVSPDEAVRDVERLEALGIGGVILFGLPGRQGRDGHRGLDRGRRRPAGAAPAPGPRPGPRAHRGHVPVRVHGPRALRPPGPARSRRQRRCDRAPRADGGLLGGGRRRHRGAHAMMDGQVAAIRHGLDAAGHPTRAILAYAAKTASAFYGPFRDAAGSTPAFGDRRGYQMDPANGREAMREIEQDLAEGADLLLVKPALPSWTSSPRRGPASTCRSAPTR